MKKCETEAVMEQELEKEKRKYVQDENRCKGRCGWIKKRESKREREKRRNRLS